jgi:hypothetical protein
MSAYQMFPYKKLVVWVTRDSDGWYCEITNRQGQDVTEFRPLTYATPEAASQAAVNWIDWYTQSPAPEAQPAPLADLWKDDPDEEPGEDDTPDFGGAYDGIRVSSDADPGL